MYFLVINYKIYRATLSSDINTLLILFNIGYYFSNSSNINTLYCSYLTLATISITVLNSCGNGEHFCLVSDFCCSVAKLYPTLCNNPMDHCTPGFPALHHLPELLKLMSIGLVMPSSHHILHLPFLLLPSIFPSMRVLYNESTLQIFSRIFLVIYH